MVSFAYFFSLRYIVRGATLRLILVVTRVGDIWRMRGARAYNGGLGEEPPQGFGVGSGGKVPLKLKGFGKTTLKSVHKSFTFTTYMQGLVSYFADKKQVCCSGSGKR